jgi:hypothetical protein
MTRKAPPEVEVKFPGGSFRAVGELALILSATLAAILGIAYLVLANLDRFLG